MTDKRAFDHKNHQNEPIFMKCSIFSNTENITRFIKKFELIVMNLVTSTKFSFESYENVIKISKFNVHSTQIPCSQVNGPIEKN